MSVYKTSQCIGGNSWIGAGRKRHAVDPRFARLGELDRSSTDLGVLNGIMNDVCCLIGIYPVNSQIQQPSAGTQKMYTK